MLSHITLLVLAVGLFACSSTPTPPIRVGGARDVVGAEEFDRRIDGIEVLIAQGRGEEALERVNESLKEWPPELQRRRLNRLAYEIRRDRFYRDHPLHLSLSLDDDRYRFGESVRVRLRVTNLGRESLTIPARYRSWGSLLLLRPAERSVLDLRVEGRDSDGERSAWSQIRLVDVPVEDDLSLPPGGSATIETTLDLDGGAGSMVRRLTVGAIYRPIAILGGDGERRYDPLTFPSASARIFHVEHERWTDAGLDLLRTTIEGAFVSPEALFAAAVGLPIEELRDGLDLLARAGPSLDPARARAALCAVEFLTGRTFGADPVRALAWWESEGVRMSAEDLVIAAGLAPTDEGGALRAGAGP